MPTTMALAATLVAAMTATQGLANPPASVPARQATQLDLTASFHTRSAWRLFVTEGTPTKDYGDNDAPGALTLCLRNGPHGTCEVDPVTPPLPTSSSNDAPAWEPHYLFAAKVVYPRGPAAPPLLLIVTGSLNSGDGDQIVSTQLVRYVAARNTFQRAFAGSTGHNNNQEIRFVTAGALRGSAITAEPEAHRPYGYQITIDEADAAGVYRPVLRYHSATIYGDGNPLAVIDSEMPNIEQRFGVWRPGMPLPTPEMGGGGKPCLKPILKHGELWCG